MACLAITLICACHRLSHGHLPAWFLLDYRPLTTPDLTWKSGHEPPHASHQLQVLHCLGARRCLASANGPGVLGRLDNPLPNPFAHNPSSSVRAAVFLGRP
jgi:hypothetical protein